MRSLLPLVAKRLLVRPLPTRERRVLAAKLALQRDEPVGGGAGWVLAAKLALQRDEPVGGGACNALQPVGGGAFKWLQPVGGGACNALKQVEDEACLWMRYFNLFYPQLSLGAVFSGGSLCTVFSCYFP